MNRADAVSVVLASAGTGKTHHLTGALADRLLSGAARPEGVIAITYTRKAAHELAARARQRLLEAGRADLATRIRDGAIGTVHGTCDRLLREFALDAGLSPDLDVATDEVKRRLLMRAVQDVTQGQAHPRLEACARRLRVDWRDAVGKIVDLARSNRLSADALRQSAERSVTDVVALLDARAEDPTYLDDFEAAGRALSRRLQRERTTAAFDRRNLLERLLQDVARGETPPWPDQVKLEREVAGQRRYDPEGPALAAVIARHLAHPGLHDDLCGLLRDTFEVAGRALDGFAEEKRKARVIDYEDMLGLTVDLLDQPHVAAVLAERSDLLLVDEFQDTSPLQLSLILKLAASCDETLWVGDPKQAIFGFQGADPELTIRAMAGARIGIEPEPGPAPEPALIVRPPARAASVLRTSYRSRPALVRFASSLFDAAFTPHGLGTDGLAPARQDPPALAAEPVMELAVWWTDARSTRLDEATAIATTVAELLAEAHVTDRATGEVRRAVPGDIAVLMRFNLDIQAVAAALERRGVSVRVARGRLLDEPEVRFARSALALLVDPNSGAAALDVAWLASGGGDDPDAWLSAEFPVPDAPRRAPFADDPRVAAIRALVPAAAAWSPLEALDRVVAATELIDLARGWTDAARRLANLEAFRAEVRAYTDACRVDRSAATVVGLLVWLDERARAESDRQAGRPTPVPQAVPTDTEAVTVSTLHGAKGLEWPIVVLGTLGWRPSPPVDQPTIVAAPDFDPDRPLAGRWIRWWPNPHATRVAKQSAFVTRASAHPAYTAVVAKDAREMLRLLYVGFTRARDRLVLSLGNRKGRWERDLLDLLVDANGERLLGLPLPEQDPAITGLEDEREPVWTDDDWAPPADLEPITEVRPLADAPENPPERRHAVVKVGGTDPHELPCLVRRVSIVPPPPSPARRPALARFAPLPRPTHAAEGVRPSSLVLPATASSARGAVDVLPGAIPARPVAGLRADALGDAFHAFLAGDDPARPADAREAEAAVHLAAHDVTGALAPVALVRAADALSAWITTRWPGAGRLHEWPVRWRLPGDRLLTGEIDLVLDTPAGWVVVDHKTFSGDEAERDRRVAEYAGQLGAYALALERATGRPVIGTWLHFPLRGEALEVIPDRAAAEAAIDAGPAPGAPPAPAAGAPPPPAPAGAPVLARKPRPRDPGPGQLSLFGGPEDER